MGMLLLARDPAAPLALAAASPALGGPPAPHGEPRLSSSASAQVSNLDRELASVSSATRGATGDYLGTLPRRIATSDNDD
jgi:hypothetical protein